MTNLKHSVLVAILFCLGVVNLHGQDGNLYLSNFYIDLPNIRYQNTSAVQGTNGIMYFANKRGVLSYDGIQWKITETFGTPGVLEIDTTNNRLLVGCSSGFGEIKLDNYGKEIYKEWNDSVLTQDGISGIYMDNVYYYFCSPRAIYLADRADATIATRVESPLPEGFSGFFQFNNRVYVNMPGKGLHVIKDHKPEPVPGGKFTSNLEIVSSCMLDQKSVILGTGNSKLYSFDGNGFTPYTIDNKEYLEGSILSSCFSLDENHLVIGTRSGGCLIIMKETGTTRQLINYQTGLPDDEVLAICKDNQDGLWICNEMGITRTDLNLPVQEFSYPGLEGNLNSMLKSGGILYVTTSEGLYYLGRVNKVEEVQHLIKKEHKQTTSTRSYRTTKNVTKLIKVTFNDPTGQPMVKKIPISFEVPVDSVATRVEDVFTDKTIRKNYALQSIPFVFKPVKRVSGKCNQILPYKNKVLVASNVGLFEADTNQGKNILKDQNVSFLCLSERYPNRLYAAMEGGIYCLDNYNGRWEITERFPTIKENIYTICESEHDVWFGCENKAIRVPTRGKSFGNPDYFAVQGNYTDKIVVRESPLGVILIASTGIYSYNATKNKLIKEPGLQSMISLTSNVFYKQPGYTWISGKDQWHNFSTINSDPENVFYLKLFNDIKDIYADYSRNTWVIHSNKIFIIQSGSEINKNASFNISLREAYGKNNASLEVDQITLPYRDNTINRMQMTALFYLGDESNQFQYWLEGIEDTWGNWTDQSWFAYPFVPSGSHTLHVRAKNIFGQYSNELTIPVKVSTPFWKAWWFYASIGLILSFAVFLVVRLRIKQLEKAKKLLEQKVNEATAEIRQQKEEIEIKNTKITDSINYAKRIQEAILPLNDDIKRVLPNSFVLFKPRDIVSGDFYWFREEEGLIVFIVSDCTGHGVPGAFMSMIGNTLLNSIIMEKKILDPSQILYMLDSEVVHALKQEMDTNVTPDGMDITITVINKDEKYLAFASANNSMYVINNDTETPKDIERIKGNGFGIGGKTITGKPKKFETKIVHLRDDSCCYMASDGYVDQFRKPDNSKYKTSRFRQLIFDNYTKSFEEQHEIFDQTIEEWKNGGSQTDDITVAGFKLSP